MFASPRRSHVPFQSMSLSRLRGSLGHYATAAVSAHQSHQPHVFAERLDHDFIRRVVAPGKLPAVAPALAHLGRASGLPHRVLKVKLAEWFVSLAFRVRAFTRGPAVPSSRRLRPWRRCSEGPASPASPASHGGCTPGSLPSCAAKTSSPVLSLTAPSCSPALCPKGTAPSPLTGRDPLCGGVAWVADPPLSGAGSKLESRGRPRISRRSSADSGIPPAFHCPSTPAVSWLCCRTSRGSSPGSHAHPPARTS